MSAQATDRLDRFYAAALGCSPGDLRAGAVVVVEGDLGHILFAKGAPLALYGIVTPQGAAIATETGLGAVVQEAMRGLRFPNEAISGAVRESIRSLVGPGTWFEGFRLYCEPDSFVDLSQGGAAALPAGGASEAFTEGAWGGPEFGHIVEGRVVSRAAVKPLSNTVWDLSVETLARHRGQAYARSVVSAAVKHVFAEGRLVGWGCDRTNEISLRVACSVGFQHYALDFGFIEAAGDPAKASSAIS